MSDRILQMSRNAQDQGVPESIADSLAWYISMRRPVGSFLEAVLSNNLSESFARADASNRHALFGIVSWLYNEAPSTCWGSPEKYAAWLKNGA